MRSVRRIVFASCFLPSFLMFLKRFKLLSWNVRGVGGREKGNVMRNAIKKSRCDVLILQETKCNTMSVPILSRFLPNFFNQEVAYNLAINSAGGILIAWKYCFSLINSWSTPHSLIVLLTQTSTGQLFIVTNVYGPADDPSKPQFITELRQIAARISHPWIIAGDFNLVRWLTDRSALQRSYSLMDGFNKFITDTGLIDIPLRNRVFTWSSKRPQPVFSKLDRVFSSLEWMTSYPVITLEASEIIVSDHSPLILTCKGLRQTRKFCKFEKFWFRYQIPRAMVQNLWNPGISADPITHFHQSAKLLHKGLTLWQAETFGNLDRLLQECKD